jgi:hypothetical protein
MSPLEDDGTWSGSDKRSLLRSIPSAEDHLELAAGVTLEAFGYLAASTDGKGPLALGLSKIQVCTFVRLYVLPLVTFISCT